MRKRTLAALTHKKQTKIIVSKKRIVHNYTESQKFKLVPSKLENELR